jgi:glycosyltransferase involved in cell wall biosynthesis
VNGSDVAEVAHAVGSLLADPERADAMGRAGRKRVERAFGWSRAAEQLAGWLREAVA